MSMEQTIVCIAILLDTCLTIRYVTSSLTMFAYFTCLYKIPDTLCLTYINFTLKCSCMDNLSTNI